MPGYVIHLAVAEEYAKKHKGEIQNKQEFLKGVIAPDMTPKENKKNTHYGKNSVEIFLRQYINKKQIDTDYEKGYFLHLITDYIFYNKFLVYTSKEIYNDYDKLNQYLMQKYSAEVLDEIKDYVFFKEGELKIITKEMVEEVIKLASENELNIVKEEILNSEYNDKWEKMKPLIRLD